MERIETLEQWIYQILERPLRNLNAKYARSWNAEDEIEGLQLFKEDMRTKQEISREALEKLHRKLRRHKCEDAIWRAIIFRIKGPLSIPIANDLLKRNIIVTELGHTRQADEIQWRLAFLVDEALLTFFKDIYTNPAYGVADVEKLLSEFSTHGWLFDKWEHWQQDGSSREKQMAFHRWACQHPECPADFPDVEQYRTLLVEAQLELERAVEAEQMRIEREAQEERAELQRISQTLLAEDEIARILDEKNPEAVFALASNRNIPMSCIEKLINCHHIKGARRIREVAQKNIDARNNCEPGALGAR